MLEETCASPPKAGRQRGGQRTPQGRGEKSGCETRPARTARQAPLAWVAVCSNRTTGEERSSRRGRGFPWGPRRHEEEDKEEKDEEDVAGGERTRREGGDVHQRARPRRPHATTRHRHRDKRGGPRRSLSGKGYKLEQGPTVPAFL
ncbi:unnamed protein product [Prorocentrum cordatum]|uniref:Uncharacterized protein n=1 Tax=Prorocentrum cordatum TaxID=2364126 RepID=A0ABN9UJ58_9DINO|nr:unnamed protein product [Polarella glacialis]